MRDQVTLAIAAVSVILLMIWGLSMNDINVLQTPSRILGLKHMREIKTAVQKQGPTCRLSRVCPPDTFSFHIKSGAANVVGPRICVNDEVIMSHILNNVGPGLNIVLVDGDGDIEKWGFLNMIGGNKEAILLYLKVIRPGTTVLVASFVDVTTQMTDEMREIFAGMGSTFIKIVRFRDSWVFAGRAGSANTSIYERHAISDESTNLYEGWPHAVEIGGCLPILKTEENTP